MKKLIALLLALCLILAMTACAANTAAPAENVAPAENAAPAEAGAEKTTIKIGLLFPYSGNGEQMGRRGSMGAQYYAEHYFPEVLGGFKNRPDLKIELVHADTQTDPDTAVSEFERLVNVEKVDAVVGTFNSNAAAACAPLAIKYGVPFQVVGASSDAVVNTENDYVFRAGCTDQYEMTQYIGFVQQLSEKTEGGINRIAIVHTAEDYGTSGGNNYAKAAEAAGMEIVLKESIEQGVADVSGIIQKIKNSDVDFVMAIMTVNEAILFTRQYREYGCDIPVMAKANGFVDPAFSEAVPNEAQYMLSGCAFAYDSLAYIDETDLSYVKAMEEEFGLDTNETCAMGWLGMGCLLESIDKAASLSREDIAKSMATLELAGDHPANLLTMYPNGVKYGNFNGIFNQNIYSDYVPMIQMIDGHWTWIGPSDIEGVEDKLVWPVPSYAG